ncbi:MAG: hypothetical protein RLZZ01_267 [Actinomycetota bacterium]|jgi:hypothetical protein
MEETTVKEPYWSDPISEMQIRCDMYFDDRNLDDEQAVKVAAKVREELIVTLGPIPAGSEIVDWFDDALPHFMSAGLSISDLMVVEGFVLAAFGVVDERNYDDDDNIC